MNSAEVDALARVRKALVEDIQRQPIPDPETVPVMAPLVDFNTGIVRWGIAHPLLMDVTIGYVHVFQLKAVMASILQQEAASAGMQAEATKIGPAMGVVRGGVA